MSLSLINHLLQSYGYLAVFVFIALESLGIPLPGETTLIAASVYAGSTHHLNIGVVFLVAAVAAIAGDNAGYWIGRAGGQRLVARYGRMVRLDAKKVKVGRYLFARHGDAGHLERLVRNLIDNALRFAASRVAVTATASGLLARIQIDDDGPGIPAAERNRVFGRFVRLDASRERGTGTAGLGLAIAREIALAHQGEITLTERPGGGTRAVVTLPLRG
jgi:signal transduction histidine kinase